jgi:hypothetical protein
MPNKTKIKTTTINISKHKKNTIEWKGVFTYGCVVQLLRDEKKNAIINPDNASIFVLNVCNNIEGSDK